MLGCLDLTSMDPEPEPYLTAYQRFAQLGFRPLLIEHREAESTG